MMAGPRPNELTERVYAFVAGWLASHAYAPTLREIQRELNLSSSSVASYHLARLRLQGRVAWEPGHARTLRLTEGEA